MLQAGRQALVHQDDANLQFVLRTRELERSGLTDIEAERVDPLAHISAPIDLYISGVVEALPIDISK